MSSLFDFMAVIALLSVPSQVSWSYAVFFAILTIGVVALFVRGEWKRVRGWDALFLLGPIFYAAPVAAFGTEHFTITKAMAPMIPSWIPWHVAWVYLVGACFIAAGLSLATGIQARLSVALLSLTFFLFVVLMHGPGWLQNIHNRFALTVALRETSFSGGALALALLLHEKISSRNLRGFYWVPRWMVAVPVLFFSIEQFLHADHVPGIPLKMVTPPYVIGHEFWTYGAAVVFAVAGVMLLLGKWSRLAATWVAATVLVLEVVVYIPIGIVERANLVGFNYVADTLMFCGAVLMLAAAMPREQATNPEPERSATVAIS